VEEMEGQMKEMFLNVTYRIMKKLIRLDQKLVQERVSAVQEFVLTHQELMGWEKHVELEILQEIVQELGLVMEQITNVRVREIIALIAMEILVIFLYAIRMGNVLVELQQYVLLVVNVMLLTQI